MKNYQIYLCGGMSKFGKENFEEGNKWRQFVKKYLKKYNIKIINPNDYYNFLDDNISCINQREIMEFNLTQLRNSDLIIVNFNDMYSLGTMAELAIAYEKRIPIIGLDETKQILHPWQIEMSNKIFDDINLLLKYIKHYYIE